MEVAIGLGSGRPPSDTRCQVQEQSTGPETRNRVRESMEPATRANRPIDHICRIAKRQPFESNRESLLRLEVNSTQTLGGPAASEHG
jgi:hypothetical protein